MKQLELVIVQFEEAKRLIEEGRVPHLRLAFILLDSVTELIMHRQVQAELAMEHWDIRKLRSYKEQAKRGLANDLMRAEIIRLEGEVTSEGKRKQIDRIFPAKIDFLVERGILPCEIERALKHLHEYRNATYHRDQHRVEVIHPAVLIYFDVACTVLSRYRPSPLISEGTGPELDRYIRDSNGYSFELPERAANQLREEVGLDLEVVRDALTKHLLGRLDELEGDIRYVEEILPDLQPGDAMRIIQLPEYDFEAIFNDDVMRSRTYPHDESDLVAWRERATALSGIAEKAVLFAEFADIEASFQKLEEQAQTTVMAFDEQMQTQLDAYRGK
jgi:hypothetical protein